MTRLKDKEIVTELAFERSFFYFPDLGWLYLASKRLGGGRRRIWLFATSEIGREIRWLIKGEDHPDDATHLHNWAATKAWLAQSEMERRAGPDTPRDKFVCTDAFTFAFCLGLVDFSCLNSDATWAATVEKALTA